MERGVVERGVERLRAEAGEQLARRLGVEPRRPDDRAEAPRIGQPEAAAVGVQAEVVVGARLVRGTAEGERARHPEVDQESAGAGFVRGRRRTRQARQVRRMPGPGNLGGGCGLQAERQPEVLPAPAHLAADGAREPRGIEAERPAQRQAQLDGAHARAAQAVGDAAAGDFNLGQLGHGILGA